MTRIRSPWLRWAIATVALAFAWEGVAATIDEQAYALNRDGMIAMSEARFEDAVDAFRRAAAMVPDYGIRGKALMYTPIFMTGWAFEKLGDVAAACEAYRRFLAAAPADAVEPTKAAHAKSYITGRCTTAPN
jgi:tetratricopeptide (TPR) repeat protein